MCWLVPLTLVKRALAHILGSLYLLHPLLHRQVLSHPLYLFQKTTGTTTITIGDHLNTLLLSHTQIIFSELTLSYHVVATATADDGIRSRILSLRRQCIYPK
jgi:hypothetical protein